MPQKRIRRRAQRHSARSLENLNNSRTAFYIYNISHTHRAIVQMDFHEFVIRHVFYAAQHNQRPVDPSDPCILNYHDIPAFNTK